jgi:diguanylate cyclase
MQSKAPDVGEVPLHELLAEVLAGDPTDGGFEVQYQPTVRLAGGATVAVEAVACWEHPKVGQVARAQFTAAAERAGLSAVLDDYVLNQACADAEVDCGVRSRRSRPRERLGESPGAT